MKLHFLLFIFCITASEIRSDMILTNDQRALFGLPSASNHHGSDGMQSSGISHQDSRWSNGIVPYMLTGFNYAERRAIQRVISSMNDELSGCIRFKPYSSRTDVDYVYIFKGEDGVCQSHVGRLGGRQNLWLGNRCITTGTITHELLHALGLFHEHNRPDRDEWVQIHESNIIPDQDLRDNFKKCTNCNDYGVPYNPMSVMHYRTDAGSRNGRPTITYRGKAGIACPAFRSNENMEWTEVLTLKKMYGCRPYQNLFPNEKFAHNYVVAMQMAICAS